MTPTPIDIAIIGMSCRLPGAATPDEFWSLIANGRAAISEVPRSRWDTRRIYHPDPSVPGKANTRWGGFIEDVELFDNDFFAMTAEEVPNVDPQQRLMLELGYEALERAGIAPASLQQTRTAVYVGISHNDYDRIIYRDYARITRHHGTGSYQSIAANRLSYFLDLVGPSMTLDTACSSGLTALHIACRDLRDRQVPLALVGAVTLHLTPDETIGLTKGRLLSGEGRCKSFDEGADGYVRGEGGVALVMRRLDDAREAGDTVLAIVKGSAVNHNGRSNGLTAPSGRALRAVMEEALAASGMSPGDVSFVETHGTGTLMGDQLELKALTEVYGSRAHDQTCWLGCVKTNIGHLETTSGLASLVKMILSMRHRQVPANLNMVTPVRRTDLAESRLAFPGRLEEWPDGPSPRVGALTAYGFGGANAHVIVQEAPSPPLPPAATGGPRTLCVSARTEQALRNLLERYLEYLTCTDDSLESICYTAHVGRTHFMRRAAFVAADLNDLRRQIARALVANSIGTDAPRVSKAPPIDRATLDTPHTIADAVASRYVGGGAIDAATLSAVRPPRASLPTYPFQRTRLWFELPDDGAAGLGGTAGSSAALRDVRATPGLDDGSGARELEIAGENMTTWLSDLIGAELKMPPEEVEVDRPFAEYGVDSATAMEIVVKVERRIGRQLDPTLLWSYPNITTLARHLEDLIVAGQRHEPEVTLREG
jgi:acyl transferase domain-containing protein